MHCRSCFRATSGTPFLAIEAPPIRRTELPHKRTQIVFDVCSVPWGGPLYLHSYPWVCWQALCFRRERARRPAAESHFPARRALLQYLPGVFLLRVPRLRVAPTTGRRHPQCGAFEVSGLSVVPGSAASSVWYFRGGLCSQPVWRRLRRRPQGQGHFAPPR